MLSMFKRRRLVLILLLICAMIAAPVYAFYFNRNFPCFGTFDPSLPQLEARVDVRFPSSATDIEWLCDFDPFDSFQVFVRFRMTPDDLTAITDAPQYHEAQLSVSEFFNAFDGNQAIQLEPDTYITMQKASSSSCGFTNVLVDMRDPSGYAVYAYYHSWTGYFWQVCGDG